MKKTHTIDTVFALVLFCVFTVSVLLVLMSGATSYKSIQGNSQSNFQDRTCISYIDAKIKHYDNIENNISIDEIDGLKALKLIEEIDGVKYNTFIYLYEGMIKEIFCDESIYISADQGLDILLADILDFEQVTPNLIRVVCSTKEDSQSELFINIKSEEDIL